jgi:DtxR family manganese transport transcriptional regulator
MTKRTSSSKARARSAAEIAKPSDRFQRIRRDHANELAEDYLEMIDDLITECGEARAVDIARRLGVTHVTVTKTVARLQREGLVTSAPYRSIFLTDKGRNIAISVRERHAIVLDFLLTLGVPQESAEIDAEGIEHHISPATITAMKRYIRESKKG